MTRAPVEVNTAADGSLVLVPHAVLEAGDAVELRRAVVYAVRRVRPLRLIVDLHHVQQLDAINLGTLAAACDLGDDHQVAVFFDRSSAAIAAQLTATGVPAHRIRHIGLDAAA